MILALVHLAPFLATTAHIARLISWDDDWYSSYLTLAVWWLLCLAAPVLFRYAFPFLVALILALLPPRPQPPPLVTENAIQNAITDLTIVSNALPALPFLTLPPRTLLRAAAILTVPWLAFTYIVSNRVLLAVIGTLLISHRAPWARLLRSVLWKSAFIRALIYPVQAFLTGQPLPKYLVSNYPTPTTPTPVPSLRFLFSIYENQRWWMGLDWTAALLPSERPSWTSPDLHPVSPPATFTLPDPTTVHLPASDPNSTIKRTAIWKWDEPEWRLLVRKRGSSLSRIEQSPSVIDDPSSLTPSGSRFLLKATAIKFKDSSSTITSSQPSSAVSPPPDLQHDQDDSGEPFTDPDGWIYSDNKWENQSHHNGLGKYTRYRRWSRVAIVSEVVEVVSPGTTPMTNSTIPVPSSLPDSHQTGHADTDTVIIADTPSSTSTSTPPIAATTAVPEPESPLRQRLRAALSKSSISTS